MAILLFDVMDTLVWDPFRLIPKHFGLSFTELLTLKHPSAWPRFERGELTQEQFYQEFFLDGRPVDGPALEKLLLENYRWLPEIPELLRDLRRAGHELHTLSNYPVWYQMIEEKLQISSYINWSFVSCHTGQRKPEPEAYRHALTTLGCGPSQCYFIDDREVNVEAASAEGIHGLQFKTALKLREQFQALGLLP